MRNEKGIAGAWAEDGTNIYSRGMTDTQLPYHAKGPARLAG